MADAEVAGAEQLVLDAEQVAALDGEVAAAHEAHRLAAGGAVERLGDRRPPVDHDRLGVARRRRRGGRCGSSPGRRRRARRRRSRAVGVAVDAAEHERGLAEVEVGEALDQGLVERVALEAGLERAAEVGLGEVPQPPRGLAALLEAVVGVIDVGLLVSEVRVVLRHRYQWVDRPRAGAADRRAKPAVWGRVTLSAPRPATLPPAPLSGCRPGGR